MDTIALLRLRKKRNIQGHGAPEKHFQLIHTPSRGAKYVFDRGFRKILGSLFSKNF